MTNINESKTHIHTFTNISKYNSKQCKNSVGIMKNWGQYKCPIVWKCLNKLQNIYVMEFLVDGNQMRYIYIDIDDIYHVFLRQIIKEYSLVLFYNIIAIIHISVCMWRKPRGIYTGWLRDLGLQEIFALYTMNFCHIWVSFKEHNYFFIRSCFKKSEN